MSVNSNDWKSSPRRGVQEGAPRSTRALEELTEVVRWAGRQLPQLGRRHRRLHREGPRTPPRSTQAPEELTAAKKHNGRQLAIAPGETASPVAAEQSWTAASMVGASPSKSSTGAVEESEAWLHALFGQFGLMCSVLPQPEQACLYRQLNRLQPVALL